MSAKRRSCSGIGRLVALLAFAWTVAAAAQSMSFESCGEAGSTSVVGIADLSLPVVARAEREAADPVVRYNPALLPRLSPLARTFLFAHECARHILRQALGGPRGHAQAASADCWAIGALRAVGELRQPAELARLGAELAFSEDEWRVVTGPPRNFDLAACRDGSLRLPRPDAASAETLSRDRCIHGCGDRLWHCQRKCTSASCDGRCEEAFARCESSCAAP